MSTKDRGKAKLQMSPTEDKSPSTTNIQRQIRNAGTNRTQGKSDHLHRGDQRDRQPQK